jgi:hypothetical protein
MKVLAPVQAPLNRLVLVITWLVSSPPSMGDIQIRVSEDSFSRSVVAIV